MDYNQLENNNIFDSQIDKITDFIESLGFEFANAVLEEMIRRGWGMHIRRDHDRHKQIRD